MNVHPPGPSDLVSAVPREKSEWKKAIGTGECEIFARFHDLASCGVARNETSGGNHGSVSERFVHIYPPSKLPGVERCSPFRFDEPRPP